MTLRPRLDPAAVSEDVPFVITSNQPRTPVIAELLLRPRDTEIAYLPGQYVLVGDVDSERTVRSYSVANALRPDGSLTLLVTRVPGGQLSPWLHQRAAGDELLVSGPYGTFVDDLSEPCPRLYLAGGSGLAPVRALLEDALAQDSPPSMTLLFSARTEQDFIDDEQLRRCEQAHPQFRYVRTLTGAPGPPPVGHVPDVLADLLAPLESHRVFIAGGSGFVAACDTAVRRHGAVAEQVLTEEFFVEPADQPRPAR